MARTQGPAAPVGPALRWRHMVAHAGLGRKAGRVERLSAAAALLGVGLMLDLWGLLAFRRARTTFNPLRRDHATSLVASGVYRFTRNPMYLGMALLLSGWALLWEISLPSRTRWFLGAYITRFQIVPEERVMAFKFGDGCSSALRQGHCMGDH